MRKRFGVSAALAAAVGLAVLVGGGRPEWALAGGNTQSLNCDVPTTGTGTTSLTFDMGTTGRLEGLRFVLGGNADLRIWRVLGNSGNPDVQFLDGSPHDVTLFFQDNPVTTGSSVFSFIVANPSDSTLHLHITARWE